MSTPLKQIHLAAGFPGVNYTTVWSNPAVGSQIAFDSFLHVAQTAERGKLDFSFPRRRTAPAGARRGDPRLDIVGRPDTFTVLAALAAVTERIGLAGTINSTFNEPWRQPPTCGTRGTATRSWPTGKPDISCPPRRVQDDASDGFIIGSHLVPGGLDPFVDKVVPLLQERGVFRTEYEGTTLREDLGLAPLGAVKTGQAAT